MSEAFKMKCPSCEASVTIRDPKLVGKKVDCPKCKFRFVVEAPAAEEGAVAAGAAETQSPPTAKIKTKPAETAAKTKTVDAAGKSKNKPLPKIEDAAEAPPKKKTNMTLIIGVGLGVFAMAGVMVAIFYKDLFGDGDPHPAPKIAQKSQNAGKKGPDGKTVDTPPPKNEQPKEKPKEKEADTTPVDPVANEITNFLPENSDWVMRLSVPEFLKTPFGGALFEKSSDSAGAFKRWMGFAAEDVERFACAGTKEGSFFGVVRFKTNQRIDELRKAMEIDPTPVTIGARTLYVIKSNELVKMIGPYLRAKAPAFGLLFPKSAEGAPPFAVSFINPRTLVIADQPALDRFLKLKDLKRDFKTAYVRPDLGPPPKKDDPKTDKKTDPKTDKKTDPKTDKKPEETPAAKKDDRAFTSNVSFLSVDPILKIMVNQIELDKPAMLSFGAKSIDLDALSKKIDVQPPAGVNLPKAIPVSLAVRQLTDLKLDVAASVALEKSEDAVVAAQRLQPAAQVVAGRLTERFQVPITAGGTGAPPPIRKTPGKTDPGPPPTSTLLVTSADRYLIVKLDVDWGEKIFYDHISPSIRSTIDLFKGEGLMTAGQAHWHAMSVAVKSMEKTGTPLAAFPRKADASRFGLPYPPEQCVGWMADLLPYLGYQALSQSVQREEAWNSKANLAAGTAWVPEFLSRENEQPTWRAHVPGLPAGIDLGATHFVGLSGVGLDAANYPDAPPYAKKLGMFGYNRQTKFADVTDGLANTILMIEVPPNLQRAWIRGGGSTVQGVPEAGSIKPFVSATKAGKRGTYAVMADGSVRFLSETMDDKLFQALSTYKGGETIDNLDQVAPAEKVDSKLVAPTKAP
jgi:hypothetical protein